MDDWDLLDLNPKVRAGQVTCRKQRKLKILKCVRKFIHACKCRESDCQAPECNHYKGTVVHFKMCTKEPRKDCQSCMQLFALCKFHAKHSKDCGAVHCLVPFCAKFKHSLKLKKRAERRKLRESMSDSAETGAIIDLVQGDDDVIFMQNRCYDELEVVEQNGQYLDISGVQENNYLQSPFDDSRSLDASYDHGTLASERSSFSYIPAINQEHNYPCQSYTSTSATDQTYWRQMQHVQRCLREEREGTTSWPCFESFCGPMKAKLKLELRLQPNRAPAASVVPRSESHDHSNLVQITRQKQADLKWLLHAHKCLTKEVQGLAGWPCFETNCNGKQGTLRHLLSCKSTYCSSSCMHYRTLLLHWKSCATECDVCRPARALFGYYDITEEISPPCLAQPWHSIELNSMRAFYLDIMKKIVSSFHDQTDEEASRIVACFEEMEKTVFWTANSEDQYRELIIGRTFQLRGQLEACHMRAALRSCQPRDIGRIRVSSSLF